MRAGLRTGPHMSNPHAPRNRRSHSRTNGRPPRKLQRESIFLDGECFLQGVPLNLPPVQAVEVIFDPDNQLRVVSSTVAAVLALSGIPSIPKGLDPSSDRYLKNRNDVGIAELHHYLLADGYAHTVYLVDEQHLQVVVGAETPKAARMASEVALTKYFESPPSHVLLFSEFPWDPERTLEILSGPALLHVAPLASETIHYKELLPLMNVVHNRHPEMKLKELVEVSLRSLERMRKRITTHT